MATVSNYIRDTLLDPLKYYPTVIQDTLLELISEKLEELYNYTLMFPEIVNPNSSRLDILKVIADQFVFNIRDEADLQEQIDILDNILHVYSKRGSIDTIENMWKYYGGDLPKDVQVIIPSYNLFRYSISPFSGRHVFQDGNTNRTGMYEIRLTNSTYPIPELREFLLKELVAAGNYIYFTNALSLDIREETSSSYFKYDIFPKYLLDIQMNVSPTYHGLNLSGLLPLSGYYNETRYKYQLLTDEQKASGEYNDIINLYNALSDKKAETVWSGKENIFIDITTTLTVDPITFDYIADPIGFYRAIYPSFNIVDESNCTIENDLSLVLDTLVYCTPEESSFIISRDLYNANGEHVREKEYFILGESLLGESLGYELV